MGGTRSGRVGGAALAVGVLPGVLLALVAALTALSVPAQAAALGGRCSQARADRSRCLRVAVPLDRSGALPGRIRLRVRVLPATAGRPTATILALAGGPGQAAAPLLEQFAAALGGDVLRSRRLVTFDQRGTGDSGRLACPSLAGVADDDVIGDDAVLHRAVAACAQRIGAGRAHYATADSVEDVEAVRAALGVGRLVLYGTSYGTKVALDYAAAHPDRVEALVLDSVVPPEGVDPFERSTLGSLPRVLRALCVHGACPFTRDAAADVAALAERLARGPLRGRRIDGHGRSRPAQLVRSDLFGLLLDGDLNPFQRAELPAAVSAALAGDAMPILRLAGGGGEGLDDSGGDSDALFLATTCEDGGVPWAAGTPIAQRSAAVAATLAAIPAEQLAPFGREGVRELGLADLCRSWPEAPVAQAHGALPAVPALLLSGDDDLRTPRADAQALAARIPGARLVQVPQAGHSVLGSDLVGCAGGALARFLRGQAPRGCRHPSRRLLEPSVPPPRSLRELPRLLRGVPPRVGRTATAAVVTVLAAATQVAAEALPALLSPEGAGRIGGLRGGTLVVDARALRLRRYSYVPGVEVTMRLRMRGGAGTFSMRVGGRAAAHGWLRVTRRGIDGRLGGHRVRLRGADVRLRSARASAVAARAAARIPGAAPGAELPPPLLALLAWERPGALPDAR